MNSRTRLLRRALRHVGQAAVEFLERPLEAGVEPQIGKRARSGDEKRPDLLFGEMRERATITVGEDDPAVRAALGVNRNARRAERIDVAMDRSFRYFQPVREFAGRALAARLQQQEERDQPIGLHGTIKLRKYDSLCQDCRRRTVGPREPLTTLAARDASRTARATRARRSSIPRRRSDRATAASATCLPRMGR